MQHKILITGLGIVSSLGAGLQAHKNALLNNISGLKQINYEKLGNIYIGKADFSSNLFLDLKQNEAKFLDRTQILAYIAAQECVERSNILFDIDKGLINPLRIAVIVSSSKGGIGSLLNANEILLKIHKDINKNDFSDLGKYFSNYLGDRISLDIAKKYNFCGPSLNYPAACATGGVSIAMGANFISEGIADAVLVGSVDSSLHPLLVAGFRNMGVLSKGKMKPFDLHRDGFNIGEGAGILLLESEESAKKRGAKVYAVLRGWDFGSDGFNSVKFNPDGTAINNSMIRLFKKFGIMNNDIFYINTHGTGTIENDIFEYNGLKSFFSNILSSIPISSTKGLTGHLLGAASSAEAILTIIALSEKFLPTTTGLDSPDPKIKFYHIPPEGLKIENTKTALSLSYGFGGHLSILAIELLK